MLQHARPGDGAFLGDVTDQKQGRATGLGVAHQLRRAFPHLRHRARRRLQPFSEHGLDRVDHHRLWSFDLGGGQNALDVDLRQQPQPVARQPQPLRAQADLPG